MAQFVIRAHDRVHPGNLRATARDYKRGDVIEVFPSGQAHSQVMLTHPAFRILDVPSMTVTEAQTFLARQVLSFDDTASEETLQRRAFGLNLDDSRIPQAYRDWLDDDSRAEPIKTLNVNLTLARALKVAKAKIADPAKVLSR